MVAMAREQPGDPQAELQEQQAPEHLQRDASGPKLREAHHVVRRVMRGGPRQGRDRPARQALALGLGHLGVVVVLLVDQQLLDRHAHGDAHQVGVVAAELGDALDQRPAEMAMGVDPALEMVVRGSQRLTVVGAAERCDAVENSHDPT